MGNRTAVFIDYKNAEQVQWFVTRGQKLAKWHLMETIIETATGREVGGLFLPAGLFAKKAVKEAIGFYKCDLVTVTSEEIEKYRGNPNDRTKES